MSTFIFISCNSHRSWISHYFSFLCFFSSSVFNMFKEPHEMAEDDLEDPWHVIMTVRLSIVFGSAERFVICLCQDCDGHDSCLMGHDIHGWEAIRTCQIGNRVACPFHSGHAKNQRPISTQILVDLRPKYYTYVRIIWIVCRPNTEITITTLIITTTTTDLHPWSITMIVRN